MICPKCGRNNPESGKFCNHCGAPLQQTRVCSRCGTQNPQANRFCDHCGANLDQGNVCPRCGTEYGRGAEFCARCGAPLEHGDLGRKRGIRRALGVRGHLRERQTRGDRVGVRVSVRDNVGRPESVKWATGLVAASGALNLVVGVPIALVVPWLGAISIVIGALGFAVAYFIWRMKKWAAITAIVVSVISIVASVVDFDTLSIFGIIFQALVVTMLVLGWRSYE